MHKFTFFFTDNMGRNRDQSDGTANGEAKPTAVRQSSVMEAYDLSCKVWPVQSFASNKF